MKFDFINCDALYGADQGFTDALDNKALIFMGDIRSNQHIFLEEPTIEVPKRKSNRGRKPKNLKTIGESIKVCEYVKTLKNDDWEETSYYYYINTYGHSLDSEFHPSLKNKLKPGEIKVRNTAKGKLRELYHFVTVYIWDGLSQKASKRTLLIRKSKKNNTEIKYAFTNADLVQFTPKALAFMQAQRFFIEHNFKEAKSVLGMDQFQTRKCISWYHQTALILMLLLFIMKEKLNNIQDIPLLSANDIKQILSFMLAENITFNLLLLQISKRHKTRQLDINRYYSGIRRIEPGGAA